MKSHIYRWYYSFTGGEQTQKTQEKYMFGRPWHTMEPLQDTAIMNRQPWFHHHEEVNNRHS